MIFSLSPLGKGLLALTARIEKMDFMQPAYIGEVIKVKAKIGFASQHSVMVVVDVNAENILKGTERHTNTAVLWYVALDASTVTPPTLFSKPAPGSNARTLVPLPRFTPKTDQEHRLSRLGEQLYRRRKEQEKHAQPLHLPEDQLDPAKYPKAEGGAPSSASRTELIQMVMPTDCTKNGPVQGGVIMKMMDEAASITAMRHGRTMTVTISLESMNFKYPVYNGNVVVAKSRLTFASQKMMEIEVNVEAEDLRTGASVVTNTCFFKFVSLDKNLKSTPVRPLHLDTRDEVRRFLEGKKRYEDGKKGFA